MTASSLPLLNWIPASFSAMTEHGHHFNRLHLEETLGLWCVIWSDWHCGSGHRTIRIYNINPINPFLFYSSRIWNGLSDAIPWYGLEWDRFWQSIHVFMNHCAAWSSWTSSTKLLQKRLCGMLCRLTSSSCRRRIPPSIWLRFSTMYGLYVHETRQFADDGYLCRNIETGEYHQQDQHQHPA